MLFRKILGLAIDGVVIGAVAALSWFVVLWLLGLLPE